MILTGQTRFIFSPLTTFHINAVFHSGPITSMLTEFDYIYPLGEDINRTKRVFLVGLYRSAVCDSADLLNHCFTEFDDSDEVEYSKKTS